MPSFIMMDTKSVATGPPDADPWEVSTITVKLPTFCTSDPLVWFQRAESQFSLHGISADETKFWHVLASLDTDTSTRMSRVISQVKPGTKYSTLKAFHSSVTHLPAGSARTESWPQLSSATSTPHTSPATS